MPRNRLTTTDEVEAINAQFSTPNYSPLPVVITEGEGIWVRDVDGNKYMDMLSSYSALNQGHCHPEIVKTMKEQAERLTLTSRAFMNDQLGLFLKDVCQLTGLDRALPMNSGAEAVETAVKAMRKWGHEVKELPEEGGEIIVANENFHGRTVTIISFSSEPHYREGFGPFTPGFKRVDFNNADQLREAITDETIGFLVEPMQGEAGIRIPDEGYLSEVEEICREHDILLALDEIQTGLGRTGEMFAADHEDVTPDLYILGKALSGGTYPVSAVVGRDEIMSLFTPGTHGSTYGGSPLAAAVSRTALRILQDENLPENAKELGPYFRDRLRDLDADPVKDVRGKGLFIGVEIKETYGQARPYAKKLLEHGVLGKDTHGTVLRFAPPLIISREQIDDAVRRIEPVLKDFRPDGISAS